MSELGYPNESRGHPDARDSLQKDEQELVDKVKSVAENAAIFLAADDLTSAA